MIEVQQLSKRFARHEAVRGISFSVDRGEIVGFLGPNGAGKTTTLRMLTGYLPPTSGSAQVAGFDIFRQSLEARKRIGYMPENVPLYEDMRVREYLKFRARLKGLNSKQTRQRVGEMLETCGLEAVRRKMIKTLSKGYRQRVGLADSLVHNPDLLILDEPTNGLDPNQIRQIRELIKRLAESHTVLVSTHILSEVEMTCNRVIIIDGGKIKAADTPTNLINQMRSAGRVHVELQADAEVASGAISRLDRVKKVSSEALDEGWTRFTVWVDSGTDARERINNLAAQYGWPLRSLYRHEATLEDVFVELTRKD
ncbi:ATP-binding cassette domain-containing protein [Luteolibacter pohnpeiensis]|uniref:ATP-binding cassette domain-containing protein n=1 Tax=Luteolibacter pohnpeiensis TaxID=454153 RepID=A0A934VR34_9BACT|nr:ATP-binding cassette domain-containing protein [Luteolibacter pohnpeiensis]MBK1882756.1 ATP-binding cassette domain-containing protein [Luteolibacter pohnpeiensis]